MVDRPGPGTGDDYGEGGRRVLIVDGDDELREMVTSVLSATGHLDVVAQAADGDTALSLVSEQRPDVVVIDVAWSDLAGSELFTRMRRRAPALRVVVYTGDADAKRAALAEWGADGALLKGGELAALARVITEVASEGRPSYARTFAASHESASLARDYVRSWLADRDCDHLVADATLVASELVTNAVQHAGTPCELRLDLNGGALRLEVMDFGPTTPEPQDPAPDDNGGRGLLVVSALSVGWGIIPVDGGKVVWAELAAAS